jgi:REP element-mobilizing transposase RayT
MDQKLLNILQNKEQPIDNQQLIDYLKGTLEPNSQQSIEAQIIEDEMMQDALEGLSTIADKNKIEKITRDLNQAVNKKLANNKNKHQQTRKWKDQNWIMLAIATLLIIVVLCFLVAKKMYP